MRFASQLKHLRAVVLAHSVAAHQKGTGTTCDSANSSNCRKCCNHNCTYINLEDEIHPTAVASQSIAMKLYFAFTTSSWWHGMFQRIFMAPKTVFKTKWNALGCSTFLSYTTTRWSGLSRLRLRISIAALSEMFQFSRMGEPQFLTV